MYLFPRSIISSFYTQYNITHLHIVMTERIRTGSRSRWARTPPSRRPPPPPPAPRPPRAPSPCSLRLLPRAVLLLHPVHLSMGRGREGLAVLGRVVTRGGRCPPRPHGAELPRQPVGRQTVSPPLPVPLLERVAQIVGSEGEEHSHQCQAHPLGCAKVQVHKIDAVIFILIDSFGFVYLAFAHLNTHPMHQDIEHQKELFHPHVST